MPVTGPAHAQPGEVIDPHGEYRVVIDPRVLQELHRKKPIGQTRVSWVNFLLQRAIAQEPEPIDRD
jgi:hypothetical protein